MRWLRAGLFAGALLGAVLMVALGALSPRESYAAIDHDTIVLLFGTMVLTVYLELAGFFEWLACRILSVTRTPRGLLLATSAALAADSTATGGAKQTPVQAQATSGSAVGFAYRPPLRGAPAARIGGGTRGIGDMTLELVALAPDHTGLTTKEQPTLYWYVSKPVPSHLEVTVINDEAIDPALEQEVQSPRQGGIQRLDLAKTGTRLKPGVEYRWFVSVIADPDQRSNDVVASGTIERITPDNALKSRIAGADERSLARIYAEQGIWYDTIDALSRMIDKYPGDSALREQRTAILEQVGLKDAAAYTRTSRQQ